MATVADFYSISSEDPNVYHDNDACVSGKNIKPENKRLGTDDRDKCDICKGL